MTNEFDPPRLFVGAEEVAKLRQEDARRRLAQLMREFRRKAKQTWFRQIQIAAWYGFLHATYLLESGQMDEFMRASNEERDVIFEQPTWVQVERMISRMEKRYFGHDTYQ